MLNLTDGERHYLQEVRALTTDENGIEVFAGLTLDESERYHFLSNPYRSRNGNHAETDEYIALNNKHERARLQIIAAENVLRVQNPKLH